MSNTKITPEQWQYAANVLGVEVEIIKAVAQVESVGSGFLPDGRVKILFEPHIFYRELGRPKKIDPKHHDIIYPKQGTLPYGTLVKQWEKLYRAIKINGEAAYKSCSWGKFQAMGQYHQECGFKSVYAMVAAFQVGEFQQLLGFVNMIKARKLAPVLKAKNWSAFADAYNGKYHKGYDKKMEKAYADLLKVTEIRLINQQKKGR